jgi:predicted amidohydrolase
LLVPAFGLSLFHFLSLSLMYKALALQLTGPTVNDLTTRDETEARMLQTVARLERQIETSINAIGRETLLVVVPAYFLTGVPVQETIPEWNNKATLELDGAVYEALGAMTQRLKIYFSGHAYEQDPHFPDLYFQTSFILGPNGNVLLRYRQLNALTTPTPHDVWAYYLEAYGYDAVFPVVKTNIGTLACLGAEDVLFPEVARCLAMRGAEVLLHSTSEITSPLLTPGRMAKLARAAENMAYFVSANSAGTASDLLPAQSANGGSTILDYKGLSLAEAGYGESMSAHADIDMAALRHYRTRTGPANLLARQRFDLYAESYARHSHYPPNTLLDRLPDRNHAVQQQQEVIKRMNN